MAIRGRYLVVLVAMCGLSAATVGLITNVAGLYFGPMSEEFAISRGAASLMLTISNICVALGGLATRRLTKALPLRTLLIAGTAVLAGSVVATAFVPSITLAYALAAARGLSGGIIGFVLITNVLNRWFSAQLGLATSIAMGCSGFAGALLTPVIQPVVTGLGWRAGYLLMGVLTVALCLPAILLVPAGDPCEVSLPPFGYVEEDASVGATERSGASSVSLPLAAGAFAYAVLAAAVSAMPQHFPGLASQVGLDASIGALMISSCMVANTLGKVAMGWLTDRLGAKASILAFSALVLASIAVLLLMPSGGAFIVASFFFGLCYARATVGLSMLCREVFGDGGFGRVYPVAALGCSFSNAVFSSVVGFAYDATGGYGVSLTLFAAFIVASVSIVMWEYRSVRV